MTPLLWGLLLLRAVEPNPLDAIAGGAGKEPHAVTVGRLDALLAEQAGAPEAGRTLLFLGQLEQRAGFERQARAAFERIEREFAQTPWAGDATLALADADVGAARFFEALQRYDRLAAHGTGRWQYQARISAERARGERTRWWSVWAILLALLALCVWRLAPVARARKLWPPPEEVSLAAPVVLIMLVASVVQPEREALAVRLLALGAVVLLWASGAAAAMEPPVGARRVAWASLGVAQACALLYCAVVRAGLWEKLLETWVTGSEQ